MNGAIFTYRNVSLRLVEEGDLEAVRALRNDFTTWCQLGDPTAVTADRQGAWFHSSSQRSDRAYFVAYDECRPFLGVVRMDERDLPNRSVRVGVDVLPEFRGKGFGGAIYQAVKKYCFDYLNCHRVWLCVLATNEVGVGLYKKEGFREEGRHREAVFRDGRYVDYVVMSILEDEYRAKLLARDG